MEHMNVKKVACIIICCMILIGIFSGFSLYKSYRPSPGLPYEQITMEQAKQYMEYEKGYLILDVRTAEEFASGHLPGAVCIPLDELQKRAEQELPDKAQMIYVYCRSGNRSKQAALLLCDLDYTNITEIGGIRDWTGETEK